MSSYSTGCFSFEYSPEEDVVYRDLSFMSIDGYRIGSDGSLWSRWIKILGGSWAPCGKWKKSIKGTKIKSKRSRYLVHSFYRVNLTMTIHSLVLTAFLGDRPKSTDQCRHLNGNNKDNRLENLCWGSAKENAHDRIEHETNPTGNRNPNSKITDEDLLEMRRLYSEENYTCKRLSEIYNIHEMYVMRLMQGKHWKHLGLERISGFNHKCRGEAHKSAKLTEEDVRNIRHSFITSKNKFGLTADLAKKYNVSWNIIDNVIKGKTWKHVKAGEPTQFDPLV